MFFIRLFPVTVWSISFVLAVLQLDKCSPNEYNIYIGWIIACVLFIVQNCYWAETTFDQVFPKNNSKTA